MPFPSLVRFAGATAFGVGAAMISAAAMAAPIELVPHRAVYALSLDGSKAAKRVESARGEIVYEIKGNACSGYSVSLKQTTTLETDGGGRLSSALTTATWEDGAANSYRYRIQNTVNADKSEDADGMVERKDGRMLVKATKPKPEDFELDGRIVLPTQHVIKILTEAADGGATLEAPVYDGSPDGKKVYDTLAVIGKATTASDGLEAAATAQGLAGRTRYPVIVSYYERGTNSQSPDYIISFDLFDNGVSRNLKLDYGDFVLRGQLTSFEALPVETCAK